jgi:heavy metal-binding protein
LARGNSASSRPIIVGRLVLLLAALAAVAASFVLTRKHDRAAARSDVTERYICPMHPEVTSPTASECPICRMALERIGTAKHVAAPPVTDLAKQREFTKEARAPGWVAAERVVEAVFERADLVGLEPDDRALFFRAAAPTMGVDVRLVADPPVAWDASTSKARFVVGPSTRALEPGETGWVTLAPKLRNFLVVPSSAVLQSPRGPYVLAAATERGPFVSRSVEVGKVLYGVAVVLSGLREGERVVAGDAFFWAAQQRLEGQAGGTSPVTP